MTKNFLVLTHVNHHFSIGKLQAYAPYVREMNLWLRNVEEVEVVAPLSNKRQTYTVEAYRHDQVKFTAIPAFDLLSLKNSLRAFFLFPLICTRILAAMHRADHLHLRCPGNIGLLSCLCQVFFPKKPKTAKYAGNWDPAAKQPWTYRLQKWILSNTYLTRNMQVLVYGDWQVQSKNVVPFFTASFSEKDIPSIKEKDFSGPLTLLFVGNLVPGKRPLEAIKLLEKINHNTDQEFRANLEIYGEGPEREKMQSYCREHGLEEQVRFQGSRPLEELKAAYQEAEFVVLLSRSEGWPKAIAEGMFYGCIPIATRVSSVPWMLGNGSRGVLLSDPLLDTFRKCRHFAYSSNLVAAGQKNLSETSFQEAFHEKEGSAHRGQSQETRENQDQNEWKGDSRQQTEDVKKISQLMDNPGEMKRMSNEAKEWSQQYTLETFEAAIKEVLFEPEKDLSSKSRKLSTDSLAGRQAGFRASPDASGKRGKSKE